MVRPPKLWLIRPGTSQVNDTGGGPASLHHSTPFIYIYTYRWNSTTALCPFGNQAFNGSMTNWDILATVSHRFRKPQPPHPTRAELAERLHLPLVIEIKVWSLRACCVVWTWFAGLCLVVGFPLCLPTYTYTLVSVLLAFTIDFRAFCIHNTNVSHARDRFDSHRDLEFVRNLFVACMMLVVITETIFYRLTIDAIVSSKPSRYVNPSLRPISLHLH